MQAKMKNYIQCQFLKILNNTVPSFLLFSMIYFCRCIYSPLPFPTFHFPIMLQQYSPSATDGVPTFCLSSMTTLEMISLEYFHWPRSNTQTYPYMCICIYINTHYGCTHIYMNQMHVCMCMLSLSSYLSIHI